MKEDLAFASEDRKRFSQLLNESISEDSAQREAQLRCLVTCKRNFLPIWKLLKSINDEVKSRKLGSVTTDRSKVTDHDFEINYEFNSTNCQLPIRFSFNPNDSDKMYISLGTHWSHRQHVFSVGQIDDCKSFILWLATKFFGSD
jgi:hypothetical protein